MTEPRTLKYLVEEVIHSATGYYEERLWLGLTPYLVTVKRNPKRDRTVITIEPQGQKQ